MSASSHPGQTPNASSQPDRRPSACFSISLDHVVVRAVPRDARLGPRRGPYRVDVRSPEDQFAPFRFRARAGTQGDLAGELAVVRWPIPFALDSPFLRCASLRSPCSQPAVRVAGTPERQVGTLLRFVLIVVSLCITGCGEGSSSQGNSARSRFSQQVSHAQFSDAWPFTPDGGIVRCRQAASDRVVTFEAAGTEYALNAAAEARGYEDVTLIRGNDAHTGKPMDLAPIVEAALKLC